jgi:hypothetical protein
MKEIPMKPVSIMTVLVLVSLSFNGCAPLLSVPRNILNGLHRTPVEAVGSDSDTPEVSSELTEVRRLLDRMVQSGELTQNAADLKFLQERDRIDSQQRQQQQQQPRYSGGFSGGMSCYSNTLGATFCY